MEKHRCITLSTVNLAKLSGDKGVAYFICEPDSHTRLVMITIKNFNYR
ncbi:MAG: hypothetical protein JWQ21_3160 [Herminiimonas sp.]|nr:hypothetical protein [Herminiimonas sp.]